MPVYLIAQIEIANRNEYTVYEAGFMEIFSKYDGQLIAVDEQVRTLEGDWPYTRTVLLRFPDEAEADRWYNSPEYQALAQHRFASSKGNVVLVRGLA